MIRFFSSFYGKLFASFLFVALTSLLLPLHYIRPLLHDALQQKTLDLLRQEAALLRTLPALKDNTANAVLDVLKRNKIRLTLMNAQGTVLNDSGLEDGEKADNHADRPEVAEAMAVGEGSATRFSATLQSELLYAAVRLENGNILRLATPFSGIRQRADEQINALYLTIGAATLLSLLLAGFFAKRLKRSLSEMVHAVEDISLGRFARRLRKVPGKEFQPLADAVNRMAHSIEKFLHSESDRKSQLEAILETMTEGVLVLNPKGRIRRANRALAEIFPAAACSEGCQVVEVIPSPALQEAVDALLADPRGHGKHTALRITLRTRRVFSVILARPSREVCHMLGPVAVFRDITELERLETVRRDFVTNVSHELRTPLTAVQGYAETLVDMEEMPEQGRRFAEIIRKHGISLSVMVDELLTLSRLENTNLPLDMGPADPVRALKDALLTLEAEIRRKNLRVTEEIEPSAGIIIGVEQLERVLRNLLENACRHAPEQSEIRVRMRVQNNEALFSVSDQGPGISPQDLGRIFERFYQAEKHRTGAGGLGLAICKHTVERYGGIIHAESPGADAACTLFFTLPLAHPSGDAHE